MDELIKLQFTYSVSKIEWKDFLNIWCIDSNGLLMVCRPDNTTQHDDVVKLNVFRVTGPLVTGVFPSQRASKPDFGVFLDVKLNRMLNKQSNYWWFETPLRSFDAIAMATTDFDWISIFSVKYTTHNGEIRETSKYVNFKILWHISFQHLAPVV